MRSSPWFKMQQCPQPRRLALEPLSNPPDCGFEHTKEHLSNKAFPAQAVTIWQLLGVTLALSTVRSQSTWSTWSFRSISLLSGGGGLKIRVILTLIESPSETSLVSCCISLQRANPQICCRQTFQVTVNTWIKTWISCVQAWAWFVAFCH